MTFLYAHGVEARDKITGFSGIITGRADYVTGCSQYLIQPKLDKDGKHVTAHWLDEERLEIINVAPAFVRDGSKPPGADMPAPMK